jgi:polyisoprenoid-binding protein YceI
MSILQEQRTTLPTGTWKVDPVHSSVGFSVKHMVVATFRGTFGSFDVDLGQNGIAGTVDVASVSVQEPNLNGHLLAPDFFDAERHPQLSFRSETVRVDGDAVEIDGVLTVKGVTKPVVISGAISGPVEDFNGAHRLGVELETTIDRTAFGLDWNAPLPSGGFAVGNDVTLRAELELIRETEA